MTPGGKSTNLGKTRRTWRNMTIHDENHTTGKIVAALQFQAGTMQAVLS